MGKEVMKNSKEQKWRQNPAMLLLITAAAVILLYAFLAYPLYTRMKMQVLKRAYREISAMNLAVLDEEDTAILQSFYADRLEFLITDENFALVYTNKNQSVDQQIERYVKAHLEEFAEEPSLAVREYSSFCVIRLRALLKPGGKTYYVYIRCEIHQVHEIIGYTVGYLILALLLIWTAWYVLLKKREQKLAFAADREMQQESDGGKDEKNVRAQRRIDEAQKEFVANISHELKTPLALIQGYAEGLKECINDDAESRDFYCDVIMDESEKMNHMVKQLLTLNQLEFGNDTVEMTRFDITELIDGVIQSASIMAAQKQVNIEFYREGPVYVWGDEFKVEEVITNFLTNAMNHAAGEKKITIRFQKHDHLVRTSVFNTGDPIPEEDLDKIWVKFYKVDKARTREYGGSGIGLSIVKAIMDSFHQKCGAVNHPDGVEFWMELETNN